MILIISLTGLFISLGLAIIKLIEFFNENKKIEVALSCDIDEQRIDIDNPSKKQFIISYWEIFWKVNNGKKTLSDNFFPNYERRFILKSYAGHTLVFEEPFLLDLNKPSEQAELFIEFKIAGKQKAIFKKILY